jgi:hypothetical protein
MFLIHQLRGKVSFKGRGIMSAMVNGCALRDSYLIIPQSLASIQKDDFDYGNMSKGKRGRFRDEITTYCVHDCHYLFSIVKNFRDQFGAKLTIGQAALAELTKTVKIKKFNAGWDEYVRRWYFGGRVECLKGRGDFTSKNGFKIYDINSSYPNVMANFLHPIGDYHDYTMRVGAIGEDTCFIDLECDNRGALIGRDENGATTANIASGRFLTTIHEFEVATRYNLISNVKINLCLDCKLRSNFAEFVLPRYARRQEIKQAMVILKQQGRDGTEEWYILERDGTIIKLVLNNAYGKTGQDPRNFVEDYITNPNERPPDSWFRSTEYITDPEEKKLTTVPHVMCERYWIWQKPAMSFNYLNVGVAASVTGAARAVLLEAIQHAKRPIYCDTDSLICEDLRPSDRIVLDDSALGAWHLEDTSHRVLIAGKKAYGYWHAKPKIRTPSQIRMGLRSECTIKFKGVGCNGVTWQQLEDMLQGGTTLTTNRAPTLDRYGQQRYIVRTIKATAEARSRVGV